MSENRVVGYQTLFGASNESIEERLADGWWLYGPPFAFQNKIVQIIVRYDSAGPRGKDKTHRGGEPRGGKK